MALFTYKSIFSAKIAVRILRYSFNYSPAHCPKKSLPYDSQVENALPGATKTPSAPLSGNGRGVILCLFNPENRRFVGAQFEYGRKTAVLVIGKQNLSLCKFRGQGVFYAFVFEVCNHKQRFTAVISRITEYFVVCRIKLNVIAAPDNLVSPSERRIPT